MNTIVRDVQLHYVRITHHLTPNQLAQKFPQFTDCEQMTADVAKWLADRLAAAGFVVEVRAGELGYRTVGWES